MMVNSIRPAWLTCAIVQRRLPWRSCFPACSSAFLLATMERCQTGKRRMRALLPSDARVAHKTGTLNNTASDVGIIQAPDGHAYAVAIYVTGQGGRPNRDARIASIAKTIYQASESHAGGSTQLSARR